MHCLCASHCLCAVKVCSQFHSRLHQGCVRPKDFLHQKLKILVEWTLIYSVYKNQHLLVFPTFQLIFKYIQTAWFRSCCFTQSSDEILNLSLLDSICLGVTSHQLLVCGKKKKKNTYEYDSSRGASICLHMFLSKFWHKMLFCSSTSTLIPGTGIIQHRTIPLGSSANWCIFQKRTDPIVCL